MPICRYNTNMKKAFDHIGIITTTPQPGESWVADSEVWVTNPRLHPNRIEYVRPKAMPTIPPEQVGRWKLWHWPHVAYRVENLQQAIAGEEVVLGPFLPAEFVEVAFIHKNGVILEYMQYRDLDHWFGQPNPPDFRHVELTE
jgi:hypothetical protein